MIVGIIVDILGFVYTYARDVAQILRQDALHSAHFFLDPLPPLPPFP